MHGYTLDKEAYAKRMRRIEGQVRGIARMIDEDKYCIDILTQVAAVKSALDAASMGLLHAHLGHCVVGAANDPDVDLNAKITEATAAIERLLKS